jgi:glycosyltransferase involved in cell wall biosynthesis
VGRKIPKWIIDKSKVDENIEVTENIPDARDAYRKATVMVAPIKGAGGTRLKILEAMATGLPVVSTEVGVAGLNIKNGVQAIIANTSKGMADAAVRLIENPKLAEEIGRNGKNHVQKYFDWSSVVKLHDPIYLELLKGN